MVSQLGRNTIQAGCLDDDFNAKFNTSYEDIIIELNPGEKVGWFWAVFFCFIAPEFMTFIKCLRYNFFLQKEFWLNTYGQLGLGSNTC